MVDVILTGNQSGMPMLAPFSAGDYIMMGRSYGTFTPTQNKEHGGLVLIPPGRALAAVYMYVGTGGGSGSVSRVGARIDAGGYPGALITESSTGAVATTGTGVLGPWAFPNLTGTFWLTFAPQVGTSPVISSLWAGVADMQFNELAPSDVLSDTGSEDYGAPMGAAAGALPAAFGGSRGVIAGYNQVGRPRFILKLA